MAREQRKDVDYFPHDCTHGRKMHIIETKYGNDGYATWFKLLEQLGKAKNHYIDISDDMTLMFLISVFKIDEEKTLAILTDLAKLGAIDKLLFDDFKVIYSQKFSDSIQDAYRNRKGKMFQYSDILEEIRQKNSQSSVRLNVKEVNLTEVILKEEKNKVKKRKEEKSKEDTPNGVVDLKNQPDNHKIDFNKLLSFFNANRGLLPEVKKMSDARKKRILVLEKQHGKESIQLVIQKTRDSDFLQGINKDNWIASFDWIFKPANFLKILEDNYARKENIRSVHSQRTDADLKKSANNAVDAMFGITGPS
ncbi:DUF4373 domain-containing protein [Flavobacterium sp. CF136]|uniref:DUF4373 domain-containing protein n=1 Tax=Flavobacterium sp. (strain CF136) TaxID=1144313 RepID=UPI000271963B|nr:DUF4373 domain-containing protein [Flavobacterium sp. CF136]EJL66273.1 hypothetical protein PMI10_00621 [Flavobacterium sp. CF136]